MGGRTIETKKKKKRKGAADGGTDGTKCREQWSHGQQRHENDLVRHKLALQTGQRELTGKRELLSWRLTDRHEYEINDWRFEVIIKGLKWMCDLPDITNHT